MGVKDTFIYEECMKELDATYGAKTQKEERKNMRAKIVEFFNTIYGLTLFTIIRLWRGLITNMKKEAQTYKEEREQQKRAREKS